jgi:hypothetical protein
MTSLQKVHEFKYKILEFIVHLLLREYYIYIV